jgi:MbtH protein
MSNPFDDPAGSFMVLVNHEEQYFRWPAFAAAPRDGRCLDETTRDVHDVHRETWHDSAEVTS